MLWAAGAYSTRECRHDPQLDDQRQSRHRRAGRRHHRARGGHSHNPKLHHRFNDAKTNGGGINRTAGTVSIESTIVAKNTALTTGNDVNGTMNFAKFNLIGEIDGSTGITDPSNKTGTKASPLDPLIGALANTAGRRSLTSC